MRGILSAGAYIPFRRLDRGEIRSFFGSGGGKGTRAVSSHDEDTTTMGVEAARLALSGIEIDHLATIFATCDPAYLDKSNASTIHAALRRPSSEPAWDFGGSLRSGTGALGFALAANVATLVISADRRDGLPTSADESSGGDGAAAILVGDDSSDHPVIATLRGGASATDEFLDRWRSPGDNRSRVWEERFGETRYLELGQDAFARALSNSGLEDGDIDVVYVTSMHARAASGLSARLTKGTIRGGDDLVTAMGQAGCAHPLVVLASALETAAAEAVPQTFALVHLADGADVMIFSTTDALFANPPRRTVASQLDQGRPLPYAKFLTWRQMVTVEPPRRPEPARVSSTAAWRSEDWKFGFVGTKDRSTGTVHMPPSRISRVGGAVDEMDSAPMADVEGTIVTFTIDRVAYSPSPPIVFAIVDFDGGGRFPVELTDCDPEDVTTGGRIEMTFRRLFTSDGIHDYFWKARPVRNANQGATN